MYILAARNHNSLRNDFSCLVVNHSIFGAVLGAVRPVSKLEEAGLVDVQFVSGLELVVIKILSQLIKSHGPVTQIMLNWN